MQVINLDLSVKEDIPLLHAKQGDVGRRFQVVLTDSGLAYEIPNDANLSVWYSGDSGDGNYSKIGLDDDFLQSHSAFTINDNIVTVEMAAQMLSCPGGGAVSLVINGAEGDQIAMWNIPYCVEELPGANSEEAKQYYTAYAQAAMREMSSALAAALEDAKQSGEFDGPPGPQGEKGDFGYVEGEPITAEMVGAAPAGYGLGEPVGRYCANCYAATEGGLYYIDGNTLNRPDGVSAGVLLVERAQTSSGIDTNLTLNDSGSIIRCSYSSLAGAWSEWEYENPPYQGNKVYRTTERYRGYPVYAFLLSTGGFAFGNLNFTTAKGFTDDPDYVAGGWTVISYDRTVIHDGFYGDGMMESTGDYSLDKYVENIRGDFTDNGLSVTFTLKSNSSSIGYEAYMNLVVKFVKQHV